MMKRLLLVTMGTASFLLSSAQVPIDEAHFPNSGLRNYVRLNFDTNGDKLLDDEEVRAVTRIDLSEYRSTITSLKGVEHFIYLQDLELKMVDVDEMDVSANADLVRLKIGGLFTLEKLDLRQNKKLEYFQLNNGPSLSSLSLDCPKLETLILPSLSLGTLDLSASPGLVHLECPKCGLTALDLRHCPKLKVLDCSENSLTTLDLRHCPELKVLGCSGNSLTSLDLNEKAQLETFNGSGQMAVGASPVVDGWFDLSTLSGFDAERSYDWVGAYRYGNRIVFDQTLAKYKYKTGVVSGSGSEIECCLKCNAEDLPVLLGKFGNISTAWLYDADGDGKKEYYRIDKDGKLKARYHWHAPGRYARDFQLDLPFTYLDEDRMMTHLNNDGIQDFANHAFAELNKNEIAQGEADETYTQMDDRNSAYP